MLKMKTAFAAALICCGLPGLNTADAQPRCFSAASLQGYYAVIGTYGANVAVAFGVRYFDGNGNFTGSFTLNAPTAGSATGERTVSTGTQKGTYTVNCDGTGTFTRVTTSSLGITATLVDDFLITGASQGFYQLVATSLSDAQRSPSALMPGGVFLTRSFTRMPDRGAPSQ